MYSFFLTCVVALAASVGAYGQAAAINGQILGTVSDASGAPVANAKVRALNTQTGFEQQAVTNSGGSYRLPVLPLGTYEMTVTATGFGLWKQTGIDITAGTSATVDIVMQVAGVETEVEVTENAPVIEPSRTDQGNTLNSNAVRNLPLVSRNPYNFILQQPNVAGRPNTEFGVPRKLEANGFNGRINYQLDGNSNVQTDRAGIRLLPISQTWVQEVQSVSNGFAPEFGNTVGTVFNTVTRSGTNDLHGELGYLFRRTPMSAQPPLVSYLAPVSEVNVDSGFADAGGPIVKDKLFFFGGYERVKRDLPQPVSVTSATLGQLGLPANYADPIPFNQNVTFFIGKVDWQLGTRNRLLFRYNGHRNDSPYNSSSIGGLFLVDRTYNFVDRSHAGAAQLVTTLSSNIVNELRFQIPFRTQQQNRFSATGTGPAISIPGVAMFGNSLDAGFLFDEMTPEVNDNLSYIVGNHALKFGASARAIRDTQVAATSANYTFPSIAAYLAAKAGTAPRGYTTFVQTVGEPSIRYNSLFWGLYAQDSWRPRQGLTITYGVRYDLYKPPTAAGNALFPYSRSFRTDKNNFAPRLGVAWAFRKSVIRASSGIFYDPFQTDIYRRALLNNGLPQFFSITATPASAFAPAFPNVFTGIPAGFTPSLQAITTVNPDFANLYSANANLSFTRELTHDSALTVTYLYTRGNRLPVYRNINLVPSGRTLPDGRPIFGTGRVFQGFGDISSVESVGQSTYSGLNVTLNKRVSHSFQLFGTYTWSHAIDDAPEQNNIDLSNGGLSDPTNRRRDKGNSLTDRRHVFNGNAVFAPSFESGGGFLRHLLNNNVLAILANLQSGELFNLGSNMTLNNDPTTPTAFQRPLFIGRNTIRAPRTVELNARYSRLIPFGERLRAELIVESTNILNRTNVTGLNSTATVNELGIITARPPLNWTGALDQRLLQVGARLNF